MGCSITADRQLRKQQPWAKPLLSLCRLIGLQRASFTSRCDQICSAWVLSDYLNSSRFTL
jgi:hypothetical protein